MKHLVLLVAVAAALVALSGCGQPKSPTYKATVEALPGSNTANTFVVMPDGSSGAVDGKSAVSIPADPAAAPASVGVIDTQRAFGWTAPYPAWFEVASGSTADIGPLSTAVQMVFISPAIYTSDPQTSVQVVKALRNTPEVQTLATFLDHHASSADPTNDTGFDTALNNAVNAGVTAISALNIQSSQPSTSPAAQILQPAALSTQAIVQDLAQTKINLSGDGIVLAWNIPTWERGLTWYGAIYKIDASAYANFGSLKSYATTPPNTTNLQLTTDPVVARIELPADAGLGWFKYDYFDFVSSLTDAAMKGFVPAPTTPADTLLNNTGAYAIHLYTCGAGFAQGSAETANYKADSTLIDNWPNATARWEWGASCVNSALLSAMDIVSMTIKMNLSSSAGADPKLLASIEPIVANLANGTVESLTLQRFYDVVTQTGSALLNWALTDGQTYLAKSAKNAAASSQAKFMSKVLGKLNPIALLGNAANLGARLGSTANLTPWEGEVLVVGNPWSGGSSNNTAVQMGVPRAGATATLLQDGEVLVAGGSDGTHELASAELFDPTTDTFTPTGSMNVARGDASATLLPDGRVLIAGGTDGTSCLPAMSSMEIYNPSTGTFSSATDMLTARFNFTATLLSDGNVLLAGGNGGCTNYAIANAELYNPTTGTQTAIANMNTARRDYRIVKLSSGKYLILGGYSGYAGISTAELFDPTDDTFAPTGDMNYARAGAGAALLNNGNVLVAGGGVNYNPYDTAELYDPSSGTFSLTGSMQDVRSSFGTAILSDGRVMVIGGHQQPDGVTNRAIAGVEIYDPSTASFSQAAPLDTARWGLVHTTVTLQDGRILVVGGIGDYNGTTNPILSTAEIITP